MMTYEQKKKEKNHTSKRNVMLVEIEELT